MQLLPISCKFTSLAFCYDVFVSVSTNSHSSSQPPPTKSDLVYVFNSYCVGFRSLLCLCWSIVHVDLHEKSLVVQPYSLKRLSGPKRTKSYFVISDRLLLVDALWWPYTETGRAKEHFNNRFLCMNRGTDCLKPLRILVKEEWRDEV